MNYQLRDPSSLLRTWKSRPLQQFAEELFTLLVASGASEAKEQAFALPEFPRPAAGPEIRRERAVDWLGDLATSVRTIRLESERARTIPLTPATVSTLAAEAPPRPQRAAGSPAPSALVAPPRPIPEVVRTREAPAPPPGRPPERPGPTVGPGAPGVLPLSDSRHQGFQPEQPLLDIGEWGTPPLSTGGTTVFLGKVDSGRGDTYEVHLYRSGPKGDPDRETVTVTIPQIDPDEEIPKGTWLSGIMRLTRPDGGTIFVCQVPVWLE